MLEYWNAGIMEQWKELECWNNGILEYWEKIWKTGEETEYRNNGIKAGILEQWNDGILGLNPKNPSYSIPSF
jgi:hypothetical protein